ncbi:MAG: TetR/AcrR family transcriptional regulator [Pararhodobacter sp.]
MSTGSEPTETPAAQVKADRGTARSSRRRKEGRIDTRLSLILTAERIFSEEGISNTPLRRITQAAGQRNESAIHYHFGSREGVVKAILDLRTSPVNAARVEMLAQMHEQAGGAPLGSRQVATALVAPLAAYLRGSQAQSHYLRFLGMLWLDRPMWRKFEGRTQDTGLQMLRNALTETKPYLPGAIVRQRYGLAIQMANFILSRMERQAFDLGPAYDWKRAEVQFADLIDSISAVFDAPLSSESVKALQECGNL